MNRLKKLIVAMSEARDVHSDLGKADLTPRERVLAYRRRERRPMATAVVRQGSYYDRLSNGTMVSSKSVN